MKRSGVILVNARETNSRIEPSFTLQNLERDNMKAEVL